LIFRVGVIGGMATGSLPAAELRSATQNAAVEVEDLFISDGERRMSIISTPGRVDGDVRYSTSQWRIGDDAITVSVSGRVPCIQTIDRLLLLLPVVMWVVAALITWLM